MPGGDGWGPPGGRGRGMGPGGGRRDGSGLGKGKNRPFLRRRKRRRRYRLPPMEGFMDIENCDDSYEEDDE